MKNKLFVFLYMYLILFVYSCSFSSDPIERTLNEAGFNRIELEKVLNHYSTDPSDSLKLMAARFLIANMIENYAYDSDEIRAFYRKADSIFLDTLIHDRYEFRLDTLLWDVDENNAKKIMDIKEITADFLILNIDDAFETYNLYPWCHKLPFKMFCEYILPYRLGTCPLEAWRPIMKKRFSSIVDSLIAIGAADTTICKQICSEYYTVIHYPHSFKPDYTPSTLLNIKVAPCSEWTNFGIYAMRTFGMPAVCDFTPQWANRSMGHEWSVLLSNNKEIVFMMGDKKLEGHRDWFGKMAKVYRRTSMIQRESLAMINVGEDIPILFKDPYYVDVSNHYFDPLDINIHLTIDAPTSKKIAYIMVFDNQEWGPIHWGRVNNGNVTFTKMNKECMYLAMYYHDNQFYPASDPFFLNKYGELVYLQPNLNRMQKVNLKRKYTDKKVNEWCKRIVGGRFQVANRGDFSDAIDVYSIDSVPEALYHTVFPHLQRKYRFFRYIAPEGSPGDLAELELYDDKDSLIRGEIIGDNTSHFIFGLSDKYKAFDGNVLTYFEAEHRKNAWIGMDFWKKILLNKFMYLPHNDDNFIREDELYELFYWKAGWHSLGKQKGEKSKQVLIYQAPTNSLLRLSNLTKGKEERVFVYENGEQVWY